jgi:hypothetical protein
MIAVECMRPSSQTAVEPRALMSRADRGLDASDDRALAPGADRSLAARDPRRLTNGAKLGGSPATDAPRRGTPFDLADAMREPFRADPNRCAGELRRFSRFRLKTRRAMPEVRLGNRILLAVESLPRSTIGPVRPRASNRIGHGLGSSCTIP